HLYIALSGLDFWLLRTPGRCPGLWDIALTGLKMRKKKSHPETDTVSPVVIEKLPFLIRK
ncbi:MAG: hypothetical protein KAR13_22435, partial [Desulfobulbaceae bacterium]|nr:hypothetical protein [Desulfobulbaceae bacterium]